MTNEQLDVYIAEDVDRAAGPRSAYFLHPNLTRYYGIMVNGGTFQMCQRQGAAFIAVVLGR